MQGVAVAVVVHGHMSAAVVVGGSTWLLLVVWLLRRCSSVGAPGRSWLVKVAVKIVVAGRLVALDVLPPVTHKVLLVKDGSDRAQESIAATVRLADVEDLQEASQLSGYFIPLHNSMQ